MEDKVTSEKQYKSLGESLKVKHSSVQTLQQNTCETVKSPLKMTNVPRRDTVSTMRISGCSGSWHPSKHTAKQIIFPGRRWQVPHPGQCNQL